jgi:glycosyltransferase involved in cell wall biosynthesis
MSKICFVSYEIYPTVKGGCGVLLNNAAMILLSQGQEILLLLYVSDEDFQQFNEVDRLRLPNPQNCRAYQVQALTNHLKLTARDFHSIFEFRAYQFHTALTKVYQLEKPDIIEFFDYCGVGYNALNIKALGLGYQEAHLAVRLHGSLELIDQQQPGSIHGIDRYIMYGMEHHALRLAETVLYPSFAFLEKAYSPNYEPWFGNQAVSKPPLVDQIGLVHTRPDPDIILFYGRLHGIKGVDVFVDAAILYLSNPNNPPRIFYLVGYDSFLPPDSTGSYQAYLSRKIPSKYQKYFQFTGQLSRQALVDLLPGVLFAVIPSYFESFCYAAHELYEAGIPLIVSDLPSFTDFFHHQENALIFDGTVSDLSQQMMRLSTDELLRKQISRPYSLTQHPLGNFYIDSNHNSWIQRQAISALPSLLICILCDDEKDLEKTLQALSPILTDKVRLILLHPVQKDTSEEVLTWFLGKLYSFKDEHGEPFEPTQVLTEEALLILKAGDTLEASYISTGLHTLQRQPQISFVGCWKRRMNRHKSRIETLPLDATLELAPFMGASIFNRFIMRTPMGKSLIDLLDPRAGIFGELEFLWRLDNESICGVMIPEALLSCRDEEEAILQSNTIDYLMIRDHHEWRKRRLARMLLSLSNRSQTLRAHYTSEKGYRRTLRNILLDVSWSFIIWLGKTRFGLWMMKNTGLKRTLRKIYRDLLSLESN